MSERDALVDEFLAHAVLRYSGEPGPDPAHFQKAAAILDAHPWLTRASIHTATVSGDL